MITDQIRMDAYAAALRSAVQPGSVVLDIGTGTGIAALLACRFGASRVYAVEPSPAIEVARQSARDNGFADRIEFIEGVSTTVQLPEQVDVIVSDLRGVLPLFQRHIPSIVDARRRLLSPGGTLIPLADTIWAALVSAPERHAEFADPWRDASLGFDLSAGLGYATNSWQKARVESGQVVGNPQEWVTLDYTTIEDPNLRGIVTWEMGREVVIHGFSVWFDATLATGVTFSNSPLSPKLIYGSAFFPFRHPVPLSPGDVATVELRADLVGDDYVWTWSTQVLAADSGLVTNEMRQSTFLGSPRAFAELRKRGAEFVPELSINGRVAELVLRLMGQELPLGEITDQLLAEFPAEFRSRQDALGKVGALSVAYSISSS